MGGEGRSAAGREGDARACPCADSLSRNSTNKFEKDCVGLAFGWRVFEGGTDLVHCGLFFGGALDVLGTALAAYQGRFALAHFLQPGLFALGVVP